MKKQFKSTMELIRSIVSTSTIKTSRGFDGFLSDRIVQASTRPSLMEMVESLFSLVKSDISYISNAIFVDFCSNSCGNGGKSILCWIRKHPKLVAMISMQKDDEEFNSCLDSIEIADDASTGIAIKCPAPDIRMSITTTSPLSHGSDEKAGNATVFRRMHVLSTDGKVINLPFYSGNAIRGQMRDLLGDHFLETLGFKIGKTNPSCNLWFFHALYSGGALEEDSRYAKALSKKVGDNGAQKANGLCELRNMVPPISLLGSALGNRVLCGRINVVDFRPKCVEWNNGGSVCVDDLFEWQFLTRREDYENHESGENKSMIANSECLKSGVELIGGIDVSAHMTDVESACLNKALKLLKNHGYIGGENRRGFGNVVFEYSADLIDDSVYGIAIWKRMRRV